MTDTTQDATHDIAAIITQAAATMHAPASLEDTLEAIVRCTLDTVPGFDHIGISVTHSNGEIETLAGTDQLVWDLDTIQYTLREGPCYDAIRDGDINRVPHAAQETRWPRYMPEALKRGLKAQLAVGLYRDDKSLGGLNLYSTRSETISDDAVNIAQLFAVHAALALGRSRTEHQLNDAIATRKEIGQALGILMERYKIPEDRAFQFLVRASSTSNLKLREVARKLVDTLNSQYADLGDRDGMVDPSA